MSAHPKLNRPDIPLAELLLEAARLGITVEIVDDPTKWPLWPADHPYRGTSCDKKSPYLHAEAAIAEAIAGWRMRGVKLRVYCCPLAFHYHLSKLPEWTDPGTNPPRKVGQPRPTTRRRKGMQAPR